MSPALWANCRCPARRTIALFLLLPQVTARVLRNVTERWQAELPPKVSVLPLGQQPSQWVLTEEWLGQICILERLLWWQCGGGMKGGRRRGKPVKGVVGHGKYGTDQRFRRESGQAVGVHLLGWEGWGGVWMNDGVENGLKTVGSYFIVVFILHLQ